MKQPIIHQAGQSLIELLISITIAGVLLAGMQGLINTALNAETSTHTRNNTVQQGRFAMQMMVQSVRKTRRLMIPLGENPATAYLESDRNGTYLSFFGWPNFRTFSRALSLVTVSKG